MMMAAHNVLKFVKEALRIKDKRVIISLPTLTLSIISKEVSVDSLLGLLDVLVVKILLK